MNRRISYPVDIHQEIYQGVTKRYLPLQYYTLTEVHSDKAWENKSAYILLVCCAVNPSNRGPGTIALEAVAV